jgi:DNA primase
MLSVKQRLNVINILDGVLGVGSSLKNNEQAHHCPFCHHHKKKLQINLNTQKWHCWVCDAGGNKIATLVRKANGNRKEIFKLKEIYQDEHEVYVNPSYEEKLELPKEFKKLIDIPTSFNPTYKQALTYLTKRGITKSDIVKYNMGYCEEGEYRGRVIIPSYDEEGNLNYFIARSFYENETYKYKNPPVSRNIIVFEDMINWNEPITLVEGVFDSFSVKRNVVPLLGKFLLPKLRNKILEKGVKHINILLDNDAIKESTEHTDYFIKNGITVKNIIPEGKDAGDMGFDEVNKILKQTKETGWDDLVLTKLNNL